MLRFLGRGSAFAEDQNCAFFADGNELVLTDLSMSAFHKMKNIGLEALVSGETKRINVIVTHTHSDHIGGIPVMIHYAYYVWHIPVTVGAPSEEVGRQLEYYLDVIEGCDRAAYEVVPAESMKWVRAVIPTTHTPQLSGRCFGYLLEIGGKKAVYTGDTNTLTPFLPYIAEADELYTEAAAIDSSVHLYIGDNFTLINGLAERGTDVYLMHLDDEPRIENTIKGTKIKLAKLFEKGEQ